MSKSKGNVVDPNTYVDKYGYILSSTISTTHGLTRDSISRVDPIRYFLLKEGGLMHDGDWSDTELENKYRAELADTLGNLFSRCTAPALYPANHWPTVYVPDGPDGADRLFMDSIKQMPGMGREDGGG